MIFMAGLTHTLKLCSNGRNARGLLVCASKYAIAFATRPVYSHTRPLLGLHHERVSARMIVAMTSRGGYPAHRHDIRDTHHLGS